MNDVKIASDIRSREELSEIKSVMEVFVVNNRIRELARLA